MAAPTPLRWVEAQPARAARIPKMKWGEYKDEICAMYKSMTLDQVMDTMRKRHGFLASRRQYVYQLDKWRPQKNNVGPLESDVAETLHQTVSEESSLGATLPPSTRQHLFLGHSESAKRHRSMVSLQTNASSPVKKKNRHETTVSSLDKEITQNVDLSTPNPYQSATIQIEESDTRASGYELPRIDPHLEMAAPQLPLIFTDPGIDWSDPFAKEDSRMSLSSGVQTPRPSSQPPIDSQTNQMRGSEMDLDNDIDMLSHHFETSCSVTNYSPSVCSDGDSGSWKSFPSDWTSVKDLQNFVTDIDSNRPIDTFSEEELTHMELAASYLSALVFEADAFSIMVLLFKRATVDPTWQRGKNRTFTLAAYAKSAWLPSQVEIVQHLMREELEKFKRPPIERFIAHAAISWTHMLYRRDDLAAKELWRGLNESGTEDPKDLLQQLPAQDRRLDFFVYSSIKRCITVQEALSLGQTDFKLRDIHFDRGPLEELFLNTSPGPFELKDGKLGKSCLRDCLAWCEAQVQHLRVLPGIWKSKTQTLETRTWAVTVALFTSLWDLCYQDRLGAGESKNAADDSLSWRETVEEQMGLVPAQLLKSLCVLAAIPRFNAKRFCKSDESVLRMLRCGLRFLSNCQDSELAMRVLSVQGSIHSVAEWDKHRVEFQEVARDHLLQKLKRCLRLRMTELPKETASMDNVSQHVFEPFRIVTARILPTMASSLSSPDLSSMRNLRDKLGRNAGSLRILGRNLPSAVLRRSGSQISLRSMNSLSTALQSLSLSIFQPSYSSSHRRSYRQSRQVAGGAKETEDDAQSGMSNVQYSPLSML